MLKFGYDSIEVSIFNKTKRKANALTDESLDVILLCDFFVCSGIEIHERRGWKDFLGALLKFSDSYKTFRVHFFPYESLLPAPGKSNSCACQYVSSILQREMSQFHSDYSYFKPLYSWTEDKERHLCSTPPPTSSCPQDTTMHQRAELDAEPLQYNLLWKIDIWPVKSN